MDVRQISYGFLYSSELLRVFNSNGKYFLGIDRDGVLSMPWSVTYKQLLHVLEYPNLYNGSAIDRAALPDSAVVPVVVITNYTLTTTTKEYHRVTLPKRLPDIATCYTQDVNCRTLYAIQLPRGSEPLQVNGIYHNYFNDHTDEINGANTFKCICGGKWDLEYLLLVLTEDEVHESLKT